MAEEAGLIVIPKGGALELFTVGGSIEAMLAQIKLKAEQEKVDVSTAKGRKAIASNAYRVSQSKTVIENAGKELVTDWKTKAKQVDESRKASRDFLDNLRDEIRKPLTEWETAEALRVAAAKLAAEVESDHADALIEYKLFGLEKAEAARVAEAERLRIEEEQKAEVERVRLARIEEDKRIAAEATAEAERVAAQKISDAEEERKQAELDKIAAQQREKLAAEQAEERRIAAEHQAEADKIAAAEKADQERLDAIKRTNEEAEQRAKAVEQARVVKLAAEKAEADKKADNKAHQRKVNQEALKCFTDHGIDETVAKGIIEIIAKGKIDNITINY